MDLVARINQALWPHRIATVVWSLRIMTVVYVLLFCFLAYFASWIPEDTVDSVFYETVVAAVIAITCAVFNEIIIVHIKKKRRWAWFIGILVGLLYASSLAFLHVGISIREGLISKNNRCAFFPKAEPATGSNATS